MFTIKDFFEDLNANCKLFLLILFFKLLKHSKRWKFLQHQQLIIMGLAFNIETFITQYNLKTSVIK